MELLRSIVCYLNANRHSLTLTPEATYNVEGFKGFPTNQVPLKIVPELGELYANEHFTNDLAKKGE